MRSPASARYQNSPERTKHRDQPASQATRRHGTLTATENTPVKSPRKRPPLHTPTKHSPGTPKPRQQHQPLPTTQSRGGFRLRNQAVAFRRACPRLAIPSKSNFGGMQLKRVRAPRELLLGATRRTSGIRPSVEVSRRRHARGASSTRCPQVRRGHNVRKRPSGRRYALWALACVVCVDPPLLWRIPGRSGGGDPPRAAQRRAACHARLGDCDRRVRRSACAPHSGPGEQRTSRVHRRGNTRIPCLNNSCPPDRHGGERASRLA